MGALFDELYNKLCFGVYKARNGHGIRFHKVEPMCVEWASHGQPTVLFLGLLKTVLVALNWTKTSMCGVYEIVETNGLSCVEIIG